jgi:2-methylcitrate dehydratase PrpD
MNVERTLAEWIVELEYQDVPQDVAELMKTLVLVVGGCTAAGATGEGCLDVVDQVRTWGGAEQSTVLIHGGKVPAQNAVLANSVMARAYDICDFVYPGMHLGTSVVPVALAVAEMTGGCSGQELITALAAGCELGARLGSVSQYDGFDPTGIGTVFAAAAVAGRLMGLTADQMLHALALAFNQASGSFQANIDGCLAVRLIQGFASQNGVVCAELAARNLTGPKNFVNGTWGYYHLYCQDQADDELLAGGLGDKWHVRTMGFKAYPSCGGTIAATDAALAVRRGGVRPDDIASVQVRVATEQVYHLVGSPFEIGENPTVNGQFNMAYCVANALTRGRPEIAHFAPDMVRDSAVTGLARRVEVTLDPRLAQDGVFGRIQMTVVTAGGDTHTETVDHASGMSPNDLTRGELIQQFWERSANGGLLPHASLQAYLSLVERLEGADDARCLVTALVGPR